MRFFGFKKKEPSTSAALDKKHTDAPSLGHLNRFFQGSASSGAVRFEDGFETDHRFDWKKVSAAVQAAIQRDATYSDLVVSKKGGGLRYISIPGRHTAAIQRQLLSKVDSQDYVNPHAYAYIPGRSVVECAEQHAQAKWLIKVDLRDFFHFIDEKMVYLEFRRRGVRKFQAFVLARIVTRSPRFEDEGYHSLPSKYKRNRWSIVRSPRWQESNHRLGYLPQGAPASGAISNLVCYRLDQDIAQLALVHKLTYTRYGDDLVLSDTSPFRREFAEAILHLVIRAVHQSGFEINKEKTRIVPPGARLKVLGLLVGDKGLRLQRSFKTKLDHQLYLISKFGFSESQVGKAKKLEPQELANQLLGRLLWARQVEPEWAKARIQRIQGLYEAS